VIKTEDKQEESGELGRKMDDIKGDGDGGFVHTLFFFREDQCLICGSLSFR
jgi:hypothetical protein